MDGKKVHKNRIIYAQSFTSAVLGWN